MNSKYYLKQNNILKLYSNNVEVILIAKNFPIIPSYKPIQNGTLENKWYIYSINGSTLVDSYYYYILIITPDKFRFYGGCHVEFSNYTLSNGYQVAFSGINYVNQTINCLYINDDLRVLTSLFTRGQFITYDENTEILGFYDSSSNNVMKFTTKLPKIIEIFPPSNF